MDDFGEQFLEEALAANGVDATVTAANTVGTTATAFYVSKTIAGEHLSHKVMVQNNLDQAEVQKRLAMEAESIANSFMDQTTVSYQWGNRSVNVSLHDGGWARCNECGSKVASPAIGKESFTKIAEASTPHPTPTDIENLIERLDDEGRKMLKLYLLGQLREACDSHCINSKQNNYTNATQQPARLIENDEQPKRLSRGSPY